MKGILFTPDNHKAIWEKRKFQTRRLDHLKEINHESDEWFLVEQKEGSLFLFGNKNGQGLLLKPRYRVGETVYVKETFVLEDTYEYHEESLAPKDRPFQRCGNEDIGYWFLIPHYKATEPDVLITDGEDEQGRIRTHWQSPIFMPAWAARTFIKITGIDVGRTRDISFQDCLKEGIISAGGMFLVKEKGLLFLTPQEAYFDLYDSINGMGAHERNWDFVYSFKKTNKEGKSDENKTDSVG